jgi:Ligand-gated ion channel
VKKFDSSKTYRTNVCERQRRIWNGSLQLPDALRGLNLTVAFSNFEFDTSTDALSRLSNGRINENNPGIMVEIMDEVAKRAGFNWRNSFGAFTPINSSEDGNKTWSDLLYWSVDVFDISCEVWGHSIERISNGVSFPAGWYDSSIVFSQYLKPKDEQKVINIWAYLTPFSISLWFLLLLFLVVTGILYWAVEWLETHTDERLNHHDNVIICVYNAAMVVTGNFNFRPISHSARFLAFSWTFWVLFVSSAYVANLASHLLSKAVIILSIDTLEQAIYQDANICVQKGAVVESVISNRFPGLHLVPLEYSNDMFQTLRTGGCKVVAHENFGAQLFQHNTNMNGDCSLSVSKNIVVNIPSGMATSIDTGNFRCTSLISAVLDYHLQEMINDGFVEIAWATHLAKVATIECQRHESKGGGEPMSSAVSLGLGDVGGVFVLHLLLSILSIALAFFQYFSTLRHENGSTVKQVFRMLSIFESIQTFETSRRLSATNENDSKTRHQAPNDEPQYVSSPRNLSTITQHISGMEY